MGTAVAKRSIWTVIAQNPFAYFDAEAFRSDVADRLGAYAAQVGGTLEAPPLQSDSSDIFNLRLVDVPFPQGPGHASIEVTAYRAFGRLTISLILEHDRLFRSLDGRSAGRLYLHDYKFVRSYGPENPPTIQEIDGAISGVERARHAVVRQNAGTKGYSSLSRIRVAIRQEHSAPMDAQWEAESDEPAPVAHRRVELLEAMAKERNRPVQIRIRKRPPQKDREDG